MSIIDIELMQDETLLHTVKPHWIVFRVSMFWLLLSLIIFIFGSGYSIGYLRFLNSPPLYKMAGLFCLAIALYHGISAFIIWQFTAYAITNKRVLFKSGFIRRVTLEILLQKVEGIKIAQSVIGRLFNYGSVIVVGVGGSQDPFVDVPAPLEFRKKVQNRIDALSNEMKTGQ